MADRIVVLRAGRLEQAGPPLELYDRPGNVFVAGFIGSPAMNLMPARAAGGQLTTAGGTVLPLAARLEAEVTYGIRPEHLALTAPDTPGAFAGTVGLIESTGTAMFVEVRTAQERLHALFTDRPALKRGDRVGLMPLPDRSHLFDSASGMRLA